MTERAEHTLLLSACLVVRDEEANLARVIGSVRAIADEIVVYDTGSLDRTVALAGQLGAVVVEAAWPGDFAAARNAALDHCHGEWVLSLDGDEELRCAEPALLVGALKAAPAPLLAFQLSIDNAVGTGAGAGYAHVAERLFRRHACRWRGRLHEQIVDRSSGALAASAYLSAARISHRGYLASAIERRHKIERNLQLARAEVASPSLRDRGIALVALGRALWAAERDDEALEALRDGAAATANATARRQGLTAAARLLLRLGRLDEAAEAVANLRAASANPVVADILQAGIELARRRPTAALALLEGVTVTVRDDDGYEHGPDSVAEWRAAALVAAGRPAEATELLIGGIERGILPAELDLAVEALEAAGEGIERLARCLPDDRLEAAIAAGLRLGPQRAERFFEALWRTRRGGDHEGLVLAGGALAGRMGGGVAARRWSRRLRARGLAALCPLSGQLGDRSLPPSRRVEAALALSAEQCEPAAPELLEEALAALGEEALARLRAVDRSGVLDEALPRARARALPTRRSAAPAGAPPAVSVVLLARGGATLVAECLDRLAATLPGSERFEVVIVDAGTTDATAAVTGAVRGDVAVVRTEADVGSAKARNAGAEVARAPLLVFLDAAVRPQPGWLEPLVAAFRGAPRLAALAPVQLDESATAGGAGARVSLAPSRLRPALGLPERPWGEPDGEGVLVEWLHPQPRADGTPVSVPFASGTALALRAAALAECGRFDEGYWNGGEDFDLCASLRRRG